MSYFIQSCRPNEMVDPEGLNLCPEEAELDHSISKVNYLASSSYNYIEWGWTRKNDIRVGDFVFIYFSRPRQYIGCMTEVTKKIHYNPPANKDKIHYQACLKIIKRTSVGLDLDTLQENGLNGNIVGFIYLDNNPELKQYILSKFDIKE